MQSLDRSAAKTPDIFASPADRRVFYLLRMMSVFYALVNVVYVMKIGALVAEALARMGCEDLVFIDFDAVEPHNLDRLVTATDSEN